MMELTFEELTALGCRQLSIDYKSMAADVLSMEFSGTLTAQVPLPFAAGAALRVMQDGDCVFRGWVTSIESAQDTCVWVTRVEVQNVVAVLDVLPVKQSSYSSEQRLESAADMVQQALSSMSSCEMLAEESVEVGISASVMAVFSSGTESVWSNILAAARWVPNAASWYDHRTGTLHLMGGTGGAVSKAAGLQLPTLERLQAQNLPGSVVSSSSSTTAWEVPPVVALRGRYEFTLPEGQSIFQPGAFVYHVPVEEVSVAVRNSATKSELDQQQTAAVQAACGEWHIVKGYEVPAGWQTVNDGEAVDMRTAVSNGTACHEFWRRYLPEIRKTNVSCLAFGAAVFEPMPVADAYPEADEDDETSTLAGVKLLKPPLLESRNGPANYEEFTAGGNQKLYVCYEGQFPASSDSRGNVSGLKFCRGTLRQYVWLKKAYTGVLSGKEVMAFFAGTMKVAGEDGAEDMVSYTQLTLDGVFINRRRTRYQSGTNGQPAATVDANPGDTGGTTGSGSSSSETAELSQRDYIQALTDYYNSRSGGSHGSIRLAEVSAYRHGDQFGVLKSARWNPFTGELTLTTGAGGPVGVDAILQRQQVGKMQALADMQSDFARQTLPPVKDTEVPGGSGSDGDDGDEESDNYPMVGGGASAGHRVDSMAARLEPFAVYMEDDGRMMMNGGPLPSPAGIIDVQPTDISEQWKAGREFFVKARWSRSTKQWEAVVLYRDPEKTDE